MIIRQTIDRFNRFMSGELLVQAKSFCYLYMELYMGRVINYLKVHRELIILIAILIISTLLRLAFLHEPFERDEGQYATIAQEILRGGVPYRDAIEIKPPGAFYLYALAIGLFGATTEAVRIFTALYAMLTGIAVYGVARRVAGERAGLCAALVFGIFSTFPLLQGSSSNTEVFLVLPLTAAVFFFLKAADSDKRSQLVWSGLCAGLALLIKPVALPVVALLFLFIPFLRGTGARINGILLNMTAFLVPILLCAIATFGYFALRGGLDDLLYWTIVFPRSYSGAEISGPPLMRVLGVLSSALLLPALLAVPAALWLLWTRRDLASALILLLIPAVSVAIAMPGKYFPHYFITIIPFLAIPAGIGLARITRMGRVTATILLCLVFVTFGFAVQQNYKFYTIYPPETVSALKYGPTFVQSTVVADYLRKRTKPEDYIFQWGFEPELYFLADRPSPSPYLVSIVVKWSRDPIQATRMLADNLDRKKPRYVVMQPGWMRDKGVEAVWWYVNSNCVYETRIEYGIIFRCGGN